MRRVATAHRVALTVLLAGLVVAGLAGRVGYVHDRTWEWSLTITEAPPKIQFGDRTYVRGTADVPVPAAAADVGRTLGGGLILSVAGPESYVPAVIWVRDGSRTTAYALSGGP